jgi:hypothetical protein
MDDLIRQLNGLQDMIIMQLDVVTKIADEKGIEPTDLRQANGDFIITPLLLGLAQVLNARAYLLIHKNSRGDF